MEIVSCHELVIDEIITLVVNAGITSQFIMLLEKNLTMIEELGVKIIQTNNFEKLKNADGIYSMKFKGKNMNFRMLYSFDKDFSVIFLHCFIKKKILEDIDMTSTVQLHFYENKEWREKKDSKMQN